VWRVTHKGADSCSVHKTQNSINSKMGKLHRSIVYLTLALVILSALFEEVDARRKILRGRKTITRTYYRGLAIPAWAIVVIVSGSMIIVGGILYLIMRKIMLGGDSSTPPESGTAVNYRSDDEV